MRKSLYMLFALCLAALVMVACGDDSSPAPDGDVSDGDVVDGDAIDGDVEEETPVDGDTDDCLPGAGEFCFVVPSGDFAGKHEYVHNPTAPSSGCQQNGDTLRVQYWDVAEGIGNESISVAINDFAGPGSYAVPADQLSVQWSTSSEGGTRNFQSMNPCSVTVDADFSGSITCNLIDPQNMDVYFLIEGSWVCPE